MNKEQYADLLLDVAGGGDVIGIAARNERKAAEALVTNAITENYWGVLCLGDAVHQFYRDTVAEIGSRIGSVPTPWFQQLATHIHLAAFTRYSAAFDLLARGYYFDSGVLARSLWEVALSLAAIERGVVGADAVFFGGGDPSNEPTVREFQARSIRVDRQIQQAMLWSNTHLSVEVCEAIEAFMTLANLATHKSKLQLAITLKAAVDRRGIPVFPSFDGRSVEWASNTQYMATWSVIATIPYLGPLIPATDTLWHARYEKLMLAFTTYFESAPKPKVRAFGKAIAALFVDRSPLPQTRARP